jgi:hypothetical protein
MALVNNEKISTNQKGSNLMSHVQDNAHASPAVARLLTDYLETKSRHDVEATMGFFSRDKLVYSDATLGWVTSWDSLHGIFTQYMPNWGDGVAYATAAIGNERSAVVAMRDSPELFGAEILVLAAVDIDDKGKITRWVDYWDGRHFGLKLFSQLGGTPEESFPESFGEENIPSAAAPEMTAFVEQFTDRLGLSDVTGATAMFAIDAVLEDMTTRTAVHGRAAIER